MNMKISMFVICAEAILYLLLYNLHDCTFNLKKAIVNTQHAKILNKPS